MPADPYHSAPPPLPSPSRAAASFPPGASFARRPTRTLHLAAAIDGREQFEAAYYVELARLAEGGALDFVTLDFPGSEVSGGFHVSGGSGGSGGPGVPDASGLPDASGVPSRDRDAGYGDRGDGGGCLDALGVLARVASATDRIGVVPSVVAGADGCDPFDLALAVATLDWVSRGRAGWTVAVRPQPQGPDRTPVRTAPAVARRRAAERAAERRRAAQEITGAVAAIWDGAGASGAAGAVGRAPQGRPVTVVDATEPAAWATAARHADIAFVRAARPEPAARVRDELRLLAAEAGRDPDRLLVLAEFAVDLGGGELGPEPGVEIALVPDGEGGILFSGGPVDLADLITDWHHSGAVDGFHVRPVEPRRDLERFVNGTAALLQHRGLFRSFHPGATLREHLGLHRPVHRLAVTGGAAS